MTRVGHASTRVRVSGCLLAALLGAAPAARAHGVHAAGQPADADAAATAGSASGGASPPASGAGAVRRPFGVPPTGVPPVGAATSTLTVYFPHLVRGFDEDHFLRED